MSTNHLRGEFTVIDVNDPQLTDMPRDLRRDLRERLAILDGRYADTISDYDAKQVALNRNYRDTIVSLDHERMALKQLLAIEERRLGVSTASAEIRERARLLPLGEFLITKVHAHGPLEKEQLRAEADLAGYFEQGNGRTFHTTLMNITNGGRLVRLSDGRYAFPERQQEPLFETTEEERTLM